MKRIMADTKLDNYSGSSNFIGNGNSLTIKPIKGLSRSISLRRAPLVIDITEEQQQSTLQHHKKPVLAGRATAVPKFTSSLCSSHAGTINSSKSTVSSKSSLNSLRLQTSLSPKPAYLRECQKRTCNNNRRDKSNSIASSNLTVANGFTIGQKVVIPSLQQAQGTVRFYGEIIFKKNTGYWVGIELEKEGSGKNDGSIQGVRYFNCAPNTGLFVSAARVNALEEQQQDRSHSYMDPHMSRAIKSTKTKLTTAVKTVSSVHLSSSLKRSNTVSLPGTTAICSSSTKPTKSAHILKSSKSTKLQSRKSTMVTKPSPMRSTPLTVTTKKSKVPSEKEANTTENQLQEVTFKATALSSNNENHNDNHSCLHRHRNSSKSSTVVLTRPKSADIERLSRLLERTNKEKQALTEQMDSQEAAWDRLVSVKESYAVRVKEKDNEIMSLHQKLEHANHVLEQYTTVTVEKNDALNKVAALEATGKQQNRVIQHLNERLSDLQKHVEMQKIEFETLSKSNMNQIDQLREQLQEREELIVYLEREYAELRKMHMETVQSYKQDVREERQQHEKLVQLKIQEIDRLQKTIKELRQEQQQFNYLPPTPTLSVTTDVIISPSSPQKRLEAQLELATHELDRERDIKTSLNLHIEQLKAEIIRLNSLTVSSNSQYYNLRSRLEQEVTDKQRIMNEANVATQAHCRVEEEKETLKLALQKSQQDLSEVLKKLASIEKEQQQRKSDSVLNVTCNIEENEFFCSKCGNGNVKQGNKCLKEAYQKLEEKYMNIKFQVLAVEKEQTIEDLKVYKKSIAGGNRQQQQPKGVKRLSNDLVSEHHYKSLINDKQSEIDRLSKEMTDLESLLESKILSEARLEEIIVTEKEKVRLLEKQLQVAKISI
ncbi:hypothetical protein BDF20DRAFT_943984 [Mycotypha africana]|uniref:uncharacterized protein n=1 Tax=Mycotypha africana TaxID=64632 RepID=UPI0022FFF6F7|nr:uncharacterized protein BDF20DRAFT_943984 [Mycotypha africana]KAI8975370.1 hypothetical protein BDF20DRAFT_943984 [Mycotypha africana]